MPGVGRKARGQEPKSMHMVPTEDHERQRRKSYWQGSRGGFPVASSDDVYLLPPLGANDTLLLVFHSQLLAQCLLEQTLNPFLINGWMDELMSVYSTLCLWVTVL